MHCFLTLMGVFLILFVLACLFVFRPSSQDDGGAYVRRVVLDVVTCALFLIILFLIDGRVTHLEHQHKNVQDVLAATLGNMHQRIRAHEDWTETRLKVLHAEILDLPHAKGVNP